MGLSNADAAKMAKRREKLRKMVDVFEELTVEERLAYLPSPRQSPTEFEVQAFIYAGLMARGFVVRGELSTRCRSCRFDLLVYVDDKPVRIIEVKKRKGLGGLPKSVRQAVKRGRRSQMSRYEKFGVPVDLVCTLSAAKGYVTTFSP